MNHVVTPYQLRQEKTGKVLFQAAFVKYFPDTPYCALMETYPAEHTKIWVCRNVDPATQDYGYRLASLISSNGGQEKTIGKYIKIFEASSEQEAEEKLISNMVGTMAVRANLIGGK